MRYRFNSQRRLAPPRATRSKQDIMGEKEACRIAKLIGGMVISSRKHWHGGGVHIVDIYLPEGMDFDGNPGLDALHHECELDEDIWPGVIADLKSLLP